MINFLKDYTGEIYLNGKIIHENQFLSSLEQMEGTVNIELVPDKAAQVVATNNPGSGHKQTERKFVRAVQPTAENVLQTNFALPASQQYLLQVREWMTQPDSLGFNYHKKFNQNIPMPLTIMQGTIEKETKGMLYMKLTEIIEKRSGSSPVWSGWVAKSAIKELLPL